MGRKMKFFRLTDEQRKLVEDNAKLVPWFMKRYCRGWTRIRPTECEDLEQELHIGLCRAAWDYDATRGGFATCAIWWMRSKMTEWARRLPPLRLATITEKVKEQKVEERDWEVERWRSLLDTLTEEQKDFLDCTRPKGKLIKRLPVRRNQFFDRQDEIILHLRRQHIG